MLEFKSLLQFFLFLTLSRLWNDCDKNNFARWILLTALTSILSTILDIFGCRLCKTWCDNNNGLI